jgi:hypothetical protein
MAVYVDTMRAKYRGMIMCHMFADTLTELHAMAEAIGMKRAWFQDKKSGPHYDISLGPRAKALSLGAVEVVLASPEWKAALDRARERKP